MLNQGGERSHVFERLFVNGMHQSIPGGGRATTFFAKKKFEHTPAHPPQLKLTHRIPSQEVRAEEKDWNQALCNVLFNMATMNRVLLLKPRHFFSVSKTVSFLRFLMLNQNLNFWYE